MHSVENLFFNPDKKINLFRKRSSEISQLKTLLCKVLRTLLFNFIEFSKQIRHNLLVFRARPCTSSRDGLGFHGPIVVHRVVGSGFMDLSLIELTINELQKPSFL